MIEPVKDGQSVIDAVGGILRHTHTDQTVERVSANPHVIGACGIVGWSILSTAG